MVAPLDHRSITDFRFFDDQPTTLLDALSDSWKRSSYQTTASIKMLATYVPARRVDAGDTEMTRLSSRVEE